MTIKVTTATLAARAAALTVLDGDGVSNHEQVAQALVAEFNIERRRALRHAAQAARRARGEKLRGTGRPPVVAGERMETLCFTLEGEKRIWLDGRPEGASATLRRLIDQAMRDADEEARRTGGTLGAS